MKGGSAAKVPDGVLTTLARKWLNGRAGNSPEADAAFVRDVYRAALRRDPDAAGLNEALAALADGRHDRLSFVRALLGSPEFNELVSDAPFIRNVYRAALAREPDDDGMNHYLASLKNGALNRQNIIERVLDSTEFRKGRPNGARGSLRSEADELFAKFQKYSGVGREGYIINFLGGLTNVNVSDLLGPQSGTVEDVPNPGNFHGGTLEWMGTLRAALEANGRFSMIELGAGWAPWCVIGYLAARQRGIEEIDLIAVEGDAGHVRFIEENFAANRIADKHWRIFDGVVAPLDGTAKFTKARDASRVYAGVASWSDRGQTAEALGELMHAQAGLIEEVETLRSYSLDTLTRGLRIVDLIHCDIQGGEAELFTSAIDLLCAKVKRVVVGTHSVAIDRDLVNLFAAHQWKLECIDGCDMREVNGHPMILEDGTQVWRNSRI